MSSTFGTLFRVTNFGESHGPAIGCVIDGCPPGMALSEADIQPEEYKWRKSSKLCNIGHTAKKEIIYQCSIYKSFCFCGSTSSYIKSFTLSYLLCTRQSF